MWFKTVTTTLSKVILANTGQALPGIPGTGSGRISEWKEVPSGGEAPFEFTSGEKQRHKVSSWGGDLLEKCQLNELEQYCEVPPQEAQAPNMSIGEHRHCYVTFKI